VAIHEWVHKADLQPISTVTTNQIGIDKKMIRLHSQEFWLYGVIVPNTNKIHHMSPFPTVTKQTTQWFLAMFHRRYHADSVEFLVVNASYFGPVLAEG